MAPYWLLNLQTMKANNKIKICAAILTAVGLWAASAQTSASNLSANLQEIVKFTQAHMSDDVILAYIKSSGKSYTLSADDMLYLNSQGVSQPVISALLNAKGIATPPPEAAPAPAPAPVASVPPPGSVAPQPVAPAPVSALFDNFGTDAGLNMGAWTTHSPLLENLAGAYGSPMISPMVGFSPAGLQVSGINGPGQFTGIQSVASYAGPFNLTATLSAASEIGVPFALYLVSADMRQWFSLTGHLGGEGHRGGDLHVGGAFGFFRGGVNVPLGGGPSPEHGVWVNYTGSGDPLPALGNKIFEHPHAGVPYTIQLSVGPDGLASVAFLDNTGLTLGASSGLPVGTGPFYVVLAERDGPTFANWNSLQLTPAAPPVAAVPMTAPATPTIDYFQSQLSPYGQWINVDGVGSCWVPAQASIPGWRPYFDSGHWEYTDAGWYWQSDYAWGEIAFHYGRWFKDARTGYNWAWSPGYNWAPAWVSWRYSDADGCIGWAPLPWDARFDPALGIVYHGGVAVDVDFGLGPDMFVFVGHDHFWAPDYRAYVFAPAQVTIIFGHSSIHNGYRVDHGHFVGEGLGRDRMAAITHHEVVAHRAQEMRHVEEQHNLEARRFAMRDDRARPDSQHEARSVDPRGGSFGQGQAGERQGTSYGQSSGSHATQPGSAYGKTSYPAGKASSHANTKPSNQNGH